MLLNANEWSTQVAILGGRSGASQQYNVTLGDVYTFDATTGVYSDPQSTVPASVPTGTNCQNALKEIRYDVFLTARKADEISKNPYYSISSVFADIVVQDEVVGDADSNLGFIT